MGLLYIGSRDDNKVRLINSYLWQCFLKGLDNKRNQYRRCQLFPYTVIKPVENYIKSANILLTTHFVILKLRKIHPCFNFVCVWFCNWCTLPECLLKSGCQRFNFNTYHLIPCMYQKIWNKYLDWTLYLIFKQQTCIKSLIIVQNRYFMT